MTKPTKTLDAKALKDLEQWLKDQIKYAAEWGASDCHKAFVAVMAKIEDWQTFKSPPLTLRQWLDLLADIFGEDPSTYSIKTLFTKDFADYMEIAIIQMELLLCLKEQGFEI